MWTYKNNDYIKPKSYKRRKPFFINKEFQLKYVTIVVTLSLLGVSMFIAPIYYYLNQNYNIFIELAYMNSPAIVKHLQSEQRWLNTLLILSPISVGLFVYMVTMKLTAKIVGPLKVLKNHLKKLSRGQWSVPPVKVREDDEFQDIIDSYNYFYKSFQENLRQDLENIEDLNLDKKDYKAYGIWRLLISDRKEQLGLTTTQNYPTLIDAIDVEDRDSHHVS